MAPTNKDSGATRMAGAPMFQAVQHPKLDTLGLVANCDFLKKRARYLRLVAQNNKAYGRALLPRFLDLCNRQLLFHPQLFYIDIFLFSSKDPGGSFVPSFFDQNSSIPSSECFFISFDNIVKIKTAPVCYCLVTNSTRLLLFGNQQHPSVIVW
jgi:hypothetical protein